MIKRIFLTLVISACLGLISTAQLINDLHTLYNPAFFDSYGLDSSTIHTPYGAINPSKTNYSISFGTGYTSFGKGIGFTNSYISPTVAYSPNNRMQVIIGANISYNSFNGFNFRNDLLPNSTGSNGGNPSQVFAFSRYQLNSRLSVYAMGSFGKNQLYSSPYQYGVGRMNYNEFGVGFNYKLGEKTTIGASFNFVNGSNLGFTPFRP